MNMGLNVILGCVHAADRGATRHKEGGNTPAPSPGFNYR